MAICLERSADLHIAQLMPLPLTASCFSKIQIGTFLVPAHLGSPGQRAVKRVCVCTVYKQQTAMKESKSNAAAMLLTTALPTAAAAAVGLASSRVRSLRGRPRPSFFFGTSSAVVLARDVAASALTGLSATLLSHSRSADQPAVN